MIKYAVSMSVGALGGWIYSALGCWGCVSCSAQRSPYMLILIGALAGILPVLAERRND